MKKILFLFFALLLVFSIKQEVFAKESVWQETRKVNGKTVTAVFVDLKDKTIRVESVLAKNQVGQVDDLKNIAAQAASEDRQVLAAINGTFFNSYTDMQPQGVIQSKGQFEHLGETGSVIGFSTDNTVKVENLSISVKGSINGSWDYPNNWIAWGKAPVPTIRPLL
jgi:uncharacterized protein YigE (DUF2233 family)